MLADYFNVTVDSLMGRTSDPSNTESEDSLLDLHFEEVKSLFTQLPEEQQRHIIENMKFLISQKK